MGKYSIIDDPKADEVVEREVHIVTDGLVEYFKGYAKSVLITGGFGRGEGGIIYENGCYRPVNDYDMVVVVASKKRLPSELMRGLPAFTLELEKKVSVKQVDVLVLDTFNLLLPIPTIARYEIKHGNKAMYGKKPSIGSIPLRFIPLSEGTRYYHSRCGGMLLARLLLDGHGTFSDRERIEYAAIEINKACLALGDCYLILHRMYDISYAKRKELAEKNKNKINIPAEVLNLYRLAIEDKLSPDFKGANISVLQEKWGKVREYYLTEFLRFERKRLKKDIENMLKYSALLKRKSRRIDKIISKENLNKIIENRIHLFCLLEENGKQLLTLRIRIQPNP